MALVEIEELHVDRCLVQGWGTIGTHRFQFQWKYGSWTFAAFDDPSLAPWDLDIPSEHHRGMYIIQRHPSDLTRADAERIISTCADAYLSMTAESRA